MPNTVPYIRTVDEAARYLDQIMMAVPSGVNFTPLMTLYLQTTMSPDTIREAKRSGFIHGIKMYPAGATTNSEGGVVRVQDVEEQLRVMEEVDIPLLIHGESADPKDDVFRREAIFYGESFAWLTATFPKLRISCEHITTKTAVEMIERAPNYLRLGATITPQHLLENRNYLLGSHLRPHAFCKPILKAEEDRLALLEVATTGNPRFFLGTDSAPHPQHGETGKAKECDCGCAGCFSAHAAIELYAEAFDGVGSIDRLDDFASRFGAEFYELPRNEGSVRLVNEIWLAEPSYDFGENRVVPFRQEVPLKWRALVS
jgi:dihydroorotase